MRVLALSIIAALSVIAAAAFAAPPEEENSPWYPSLQAFEHYDSGRSHVFSQAEFRGSFHQPNAVKELRSSELAYPSGYNMSYLNENEIFIQGGSYGDHHGSIGPFVAKVDPQTLEPVWFKQLRITKTSPQPMNREWDYPGGMAILNNGFIYVVSGYWIYKVNPENGHLVSKRELPTTVYLRSNWPCTNPVLYEPTPTDNSLNTSYNGINALPDGTILLKSLYRQAGCNLDGPTAALQCPQFSNLPQSVLVTVNPHTLEIIDKFQLTAPAPARPTIARWRGVDYVYLVEHVATPRRYSVTNGIISPDDSWQPPSVSDIYAGQQPGGSLIVMNEWIVGATNSVPATGALTVFAIHQDAEEASNVLSVQPFKDDPVAPELRAAFQQASPLPLSCGPDNVPPVPLPTALPGNPAISWAGMSLEADSENGLFYGVETLARKVAAFRIHKSHIETVWKQTQTTSEWATLIGPKHHRVWVSTDIPVPEIPGGNHTDAVVWRDARTGRELARSGQLPAMTQGSAVQPGYDGSMYFPGVEGMLIKLTPAPVPRGQGHGSRP